MPTYMNAATRKNATTHTCEFGFKVQDINIALPFFKSSFIYIFSRLQNSRTPSHTISLILSLITCVRKISKSNH